MATKIICDKCKKMSEEEEWDGFIFLVEMTTLEQKKFHICSECTESIDTLIVNKVREFFNLKNDINLWTMLPYEENAK